MCVHWKELGEGSVFIKIVILSLFDKLAFNFQLLFFEFLNHNNL